MSPCSINLGVGVYVAGGSIRKDEVAIGRYNRGVGRVSGIARRRSRVRKAIEAPAVSASTVRIRLV